MTMDTPTLRRFRSRTQDLLRVLAGSRAVRVGALAFLQGALGAAGSWAALELIALLTMR